MKLHSTTDRNIKTDLCRGLVDCLAPDGSLYMPDSFPVLPAALFRNVAELKLSEVAYIVGTSLFGSLLTPEEIKIYSEEALDFPVPLQEIKPGKYILELFHGPTGSVKDVGLRLMRRLLEKAEQKIGSQPRNIIMATAGDALSLADAFKDSNRTLAILFPRHSITRTELAAISDYGNVLPIEVNGTFDDCQLLVKAVLKADREAHIQQWTSANSLNLARELPLLLVFFYAYARMVALHGMRMNLNICLPCGNLGSLAAGLMAKRMGLPVDKFIAANNANDIFVKYIKTGGFQPRTALETLARGMDVGNPANLSRIIDLYDSDLEMLRQDIVAVSYSDDEIRETIALFRKDYDYRLDARGALAARAMMESDRILGSQHHTIDLAIVGYRPVSDAPEGYVPVHRPYKIPPTLEALNRILKEHIGQF